MTAELRAALSAAQAQAAAAEERASATEGRVAAAEERHQQLEAALNESHSSLQQRNAELALVKKVGGWRAEGITSWGGHVAPAGLAEPCFSDGWHSSLHDQAC